MSIKSQKEDLSKLITALYNNMRTLTFKAQPTNAFSLPSIKCSAAPPSFRLCCLNCAQRFDLTIARSAVNRKLGGTAEHLIDGSKKRISRLRFEF